MWSKDDRTIYYVSDRSGAQNIWADDLNGKRRQVTQFKDGRVLWPSIGYDGKTIVFERNFQVWKLDTSSGRAAAAACSHSSQTSGRKPEPGAADSVSNSSPREP